MGQWALRRGDLQQVLHTNRRSVEVGSGGVSGCAVRCVVTPVVEEGVSGCTVWRWRWRVATPVACGAAIRILATRVAAVWCLSLAVNGIQSHNVSTTARSPHAVWHNVPLC